MKYKVDTLQYGYYRDTYKHDTQEELEADLLNCAMLSSIRILEIWEDGEPMDRTRKRVLLSIARKTAQKYLPEIFLQLKPLN